MASSIVPERLGFWRGLAGKSLKQQDKETQLLALQAPRRVNFHSNTPLAKAAAMTTPARFIEA